MKNRFLSISLAFLCLILFLIPISSTASASNAQSTSPTVAYANFNANPMSGYAPLRVQFTDASQNAASRSWDFNSEGIADSSEVSPAHTYAVSGTYTATLTVSNANGTNSKTSPITVLQVASGGSSDSSPESEKSIVLPVANFNANPISGYAPLRVQFTDASQNAASRSWDFNSDGIADSSEVSPVYTYPVSGTYTATLTVSNVNGTKSKTAPITVLQVTSNSGGSSDSSPEPEKSIVLPVANFNANPMSGYAPLAVQFTDQSENANGWSWDFGDGKTSTEQNPTHTYSGAGSYTVKFTVTNDTGSNTKSFAINVLVTKEQIQYTPTEQPQYTPMEQPQPSSASVSLHGEKTNVAMGEDILLKLSAVNFITKPLMHAQVIIIPPSGMSVFSSDFVESGAGQYTTTYDIEPEKGRDIEVKIKANQVGNFNVKGRVVYYFGDNKKDGYDYPLDLPIQVEESPETKSSNQPTTDPMPSPHTSGLGVASTVFILIMVFLLRRK